MRLRCRALLDKAQSFGRAANGMADEAALALALQSMPLQDQAVASAADDGGGGPGRRCRAGW